jgi:hypothetical protein
MIQLNIGLNNNPYLFEQCSNILQDMFNCKTRLDYSKWENNPEPTVVVKIDGTVEYEQIEVLCLFFTQDAIALKISGFGCLVYRPDYVGERYSYNEEYFINY